MKKVTLLGFICLALMLTVMSFGACAQQAQAPVTVTVKSTVTVTPPAATLAAKEQVYTVLNPVAKWPPIEVKGLAPRLTSLEGKKVGVINLHGGNEQAIISVVADLKAAVPGCNVLYYRTEGGMGGAGPMTDNDLKILKSCDALILGHNF